MRILETKGDFWSVTLDLARQAGGDIIILEPSGTAYNPIYEDLPPHRTDG